MESVTTAGLFFKIIKKWQRKHETSVTEHKFDWKVPLIFNLAFSFITFGFRDIETNENKVLFVFLF